MPDAPAKSRRRLKYKWYSDDDRVFALRSLEANGGNLSRTARELGVPLSTLHQWATLKRRGSVLRKRDVRGDRLHMLCVFRDRPVPVVTSGPPVYLDLSRLTARQHADLVRLCDKARVAPVPPEQTAIPGDGL
jgi:transposase-like protein